MFGTKLRIRHSRPSVGYENPLHREADRSRPDYAEVHRTAPKYTARIQQVEGTAMSTAILISPAVVNGAQFRAAPRSSRLRITRRGYALLILVVAAPLVIVAFGLAVNGGAASAGADVSSATFEHVTVHPGESLWQLASEIAPSSDPRDVVSDLAQLNRLASAEVQPGQILAVPLKYSR